MARLCIALACFSLSTAAFAQTAPGPANVVTPAPPPRAGTVGPEQLRDFALPGTRTEPAPAATDPAPAPAPSTTRPRPATPRAEAAPPPSAAPAAEVTRSAPTVSTRQPATAETTPSPAPELPSALPPATSAPAEPAPTTAAPDLAPLTVSEPAVPASGPATGFGWWPWMIGAALAGIALALALRSRRQRLAPAGGDLGRALFLAPDAPPAPAPAPRPAPPARSPAPSARPVPAAPEPSSTLPAGVVTTRLRPAPPAAPPAPAPPAAPPAPASAPAPQPAPVGAVVSRRLRPWLDLDLAVREILLDEAEALIRFDLVIVNGGAAGARAIVVEALALNAGDQQGQELSRFFALAPSTAEGIDEIAPMASATVSHEIRMPRSAIRAYEAQGRSLFVPVIAFNATYRAGAGEGRTSAAYLIGRERPGADRLAPLPLDPGAARMLGLGVRRLDEAVRR
ncbi:hypothetical protein [Sphingomonas astaxanthinifaciens]|uniref:hypothetical protein n=1 Tax=Sphingomonas astaxanthinifaciens TaxID=407019 RepID=UPI0004A6DDB7|nr:hypothetical protein [Sphingomonas astaxanthinifaciens]